MLWLLYFVVYFDTLTIKVFGILFKNTFRCIFAHPWTYWPWRFMKKIFERVLHSGCCPQDLCWPCLSVCSGCCPQERCWTCLAVCSGGFSYCSTQQTAVNKSLSWSRVFYHLAIRKVLSLRYTIIVIVIVNSRTDSNSLKWCRTTRLQASIRPEQVEERGCLSSEIHSLSVLFSYS